MTSSGRIVCSSSPRWTNSSPTKSSDRVSCVSCPWCLERVSHLTRLTGLQQEQPQYYTSLSSHLSPDEQNVIQTVVQQAEANQVQAQQQAQQAAVAGTANGATR